MLFDNLKDLIKDFIKENNIKDKKQIINLLEKLINYYND